MAETSGDMNRRLRPAELQADRDAHDALKGISDYKPANAAYTAANVDAARTAMEAGQAREVQKQAEADAARDEAVRSEHAYHSLLRGVKDQVVAQYGRSSDQAQAVGLKKESERKRPTRRPKPDDGTTPENKPA